jgi:DAK2 domain fusion protein YloV
MTRMNRSAGDSTTSRGPLPGGDGPAKASVLDGDDLRSAFQVATGYLERYREAINALNVFPVPDGDTGTNMLLTMRSVNQSSSQSPGSSAGEAMAAMAQGAIMGARGNGGVILSQFFQGMSQGLHEKEHCSGEDLAHAFKLASEAAYRAVSNPREGTILTVIRELSMVAEECAATGTLDTVSVWKYALDGAKEALARTPLQLPVLLEAGVVDAGGQGIVTLLEGAWRYLAGEDLEEELELSIPITDPLAAGAAPTRSMSSSHPVVQEEYLAATEEDVYGYCTQLLIHGEGLDADRIREEISGIGASTVVVGGGALVKVHTHAYDPGKVVSYAVSQGTISQVSMENMDQQHQDFMALHRGRSQASLDDVPGGISAGASTTEAVAVVAVAWGEGFTNLFRELGCAAIVTGGQTMNPSTQELLDAAMSAGAREVILLPNNSNIIPTAQQAVNLTAGYTNQADPGHTDHPVKLHLVPSRTIPQGVAAILALTPEGNPDENLESMTRALPSVKTIEVTRAVRPVTLGGISVKEGEYIGLLEGDLVAAGDSDISVLQSALLEAEASDGGLVTLYRGLDIEEEQAEEAADKIRESIPGLEVEVVYGGQPLYQYIASLE